MPTYYFVSNFPYTDAPGKDMGQRLNEALNVKDYSQLPDDYLVTLYPSFEDALAASEADEFATTENQHYLIVKVRGPKIELSEKEKAHFEPGDGLEVNAGAFRMVSVYRGKKRLAHLESPYSSANVAESALTFFNNARNYIKKNPISFSMGAVAISLFSLYMGKSFFVGATGLLLPLLVCLCLGAMGYLVGTMIWDNIKNNTLKSKKSRGTRPSLETRPSVEDTVRLEEGLAATTSPAPSASHSATAKSLSPAPAPAALASPLPSAIFSPKATAPTPTGSAPTYIDVVVETPQSPEDLSPDELKLRNLLKRIEELETELNYIKDDKLVRAFKSAIDTEPELPYQIEIAEKEISLLQGLRTTLERDKPKRDTGREGKGVNRAAEEKTVTSALEKEVSNLNRRHQSSSYVF